mgnify:CR=1 FL=1
MKIYTKTGDQGSTSLYGGKRLPKNDIRIEAYGTIDELNSWIGLIGDQVEETSRQFLRKNQEILFVIGSHLAKDQDKEMPLPVLDDAALNGLEDAIDRMDEELIPMTHFILPGGNKLVSQIHITRTVCRRAERSVVALSQLQILDAFIIKYLNRLSDYLFVLSRWVAKKNNVEEIKWIPKK